MLVTKQVLDEHIQDLKQLPWQWRTQEKVHSQDLKQLPWKLRTQEQVHNQDLKQLQWKWMTQEKVQIQDLHRTIWCLKLPRYHVCIDDLLCSMFLRLYTVGSQ